jgi:hypothetical protein
MSQTDRNPTLELYEAFISALCACLRGRRLNVGMYFTEAQGYWRGWRSSLRPYRLWHYFCASENHGSVARYQPLSWLKVYMRHPKFNIERLEALPPGQCALKLPLAKRR